MNNKTRLYSILLLRSVLFYTIFILMGLAMTGKTERAYEVLQPKEIVQVATHGWNVEMMVKHFRPTISAPEEQPTDSPTATDILYEVIETPKTYSLVYHIGWENQTHPSASTNIVNSIFRFFYHGFTLRDSEIIQLDIDKSSGKIIKILYDGTAAGHDYLATDPNRTRYEAIWQQDQTFELAQLNEEGERSAAQPLALSPTAPPQFVVSSWEHLLALQPTKANIENPESTLPLAFLDAEKYRQDKYVRWAQGDYRSEETPANVPVMLFVSLIFTGYLFMLQKGYLQKQITPDAMDEERQKII